MAIATMRKLRLIGLVTERDALLDRLMQRGCLEVTEISGQTDPDFAALVTRNETDLGRFRTAYTQLDAALKTLKKYAPEKSGLFIKRRDVTGEELFSAGLWHDAEEAAAQITAAGARIERLHAEESSLRSDLLSYEPWCGTDFPLDYKGTREAGVLFGAVPATHPLEELEQALAEAVPEAQIFPAQCDKRLNRFALVYLLSRGDEVQDLLRRHDFTSAVFRETDGTALALADRTEQRMEEVRYQLDEYQQEIVDLAAHRGDLELCLDRCTQEIAREEAKEHLVVSGRIFALEGWLDAEQELPLQTDLNDFTCAWEFSDPAEGEPTPTLLKNPKWMQAINVVTEMYSLPAYGTIDPNPLIFFTYIFFFGFMFADLAYGLIIFLASTLIVKKYDPKGTMGYIFHLGRYLGISTAVCGFFVGGFFGDAITAVATWLGLGALPGWLQAFCDGLLLNPMRDPMTVFLVSIVIGVVHLLFGQCVHIYLGFRDGHAVDHLLDVLPWWLLFAGIAVLALQGSPVVLLLGILALILTQGRHKQGGLLKKLMGGVTSLYDVTSWLSDILSYCRLMALMLATSVIASVANTLATLMPPPVGIVVFLIVFVVFHAINIGINLIGTFVHAARLHYLEFFGKFFTTGGIPFRPLQYKTKYVNIIEEEKVS